MKSKFKGFYKDFLLENNQFLNNATIVMDTNVLLDIYRYSKETADQILQLMETLKERLWMPYQVAEEYHKDRNEKVLGEHVRTYSQFIKNIDDLEKTFNDKRKHPFLENDDIISLKANLLNIKKILCRGKENCALLIREDEYKNKIANLYAGKLGEDYPIEVKEEHFRVAQKRYDEKVPPGYKDSSKNDNKYGDFLIWQQMIDYANSTKKPVVFVSNDLKEDWIEEVAGIKIGPRPELIDEFSKETNQWFYCYNINQFINMINNQIVTNEAKAEIESHLEEEKFLQDVVMGEATPTSSPVEVYMGDTENEQVVSEV